MCLRFRYTLIRVWAHGKPMLVVCMLNPSTADADLDDPTVRELIYFAELWGYGGIYIVNEYALRSSSPAFMALYDDARGPENGKHVRRALEYSQTHRIPALAAWGNHGTGRMFSAMARELGVPLICMGTNADGSPKHPMARGVHRIPRDQQPIEWRA